MLRTILGLLFLLTCKSSIACSCIGTQTIKNAVKFSDAVIVGTILGKQLITLYDSSAFKMFHQKYPDRNFAIMKTTFASYDIEVHNVYKGKLTKDTIKIFTGLGGGDCGKEFDSGTKYIIYGKKESHSGLAHYYNYSKIRKVLWTNICSRTKKYEQSEVDSIKQYVRFRKRLINKH